MFQKVMEFEPTQCVTHFTFRRHNVINVRCAEESAFFSMFKVNFTMIF